MTDECSTNNGGCDHACINSPRGARCQCQKGYALTHKSCHGEIPAQSQCVAQYEIDHYDAYNHAHTYIHSPTLQHTHTHTHIYIYIYIYIYIIYTHTTHKHTHIYTHMCMHSRTHTNTYIHTCICDTLYHAYYACMHAQHKTRVFLALNISFQFFFLYFHLDINECSAYGTCSQTCMNTHGSYSCGCVYGYRRTQFANISGIDCKAVG